VDSIRTDLREFIYSKFPLARKRQVKDTDPLLESGLIDSMGVLDVVQFIEQKFSFTVEDDDLTSENFQTIDGIANFIECKAADTGVTRV
jgi:acyl carrier protein